MLEIFIIFYCIKSFLEIYTLFMQIKYVKNAKNLEPIILLDSSKYKEAANCSIGKDKLGMYLSGYNFILFILCDSNRLLLFKSNNFCKYFHFYKFDSYFTI